MIRRTALAALLSGTICACTGVLGPPASTPDGQQRADAVGRLTDGPSGAGRDAPAAPVADAAAPDAHAPDAYRPPPDASLPPDAFRADAAPPPDGATWAAYDFALVDLNPASPTYNQTRRLSDNLGKVMIVYDVNFT